MKDFRDPVVWQRSHQLTIELYRVTKSFPDDERFGIVSQLRRSAASVAANIAEGCGRGSDSDFARFLQMAMGSASETEYHLLLAADLEYLDKARAGVLISQMQEVKRMLASFLQKLKADR
ncbi:MAG: four helix bundle protein [Planctomycetota bacterium]